MYYGKVEICGVNTAKLKTLSAEQTRELLVRSKADGMTAERKRINGGCKLFYARNRQMIQYHFTPEGILERSSRKT